MSDELFNPPNVKLEEVSVDSLAYIGDAVYNLYIKLKIFKNMKLSDLNKLMNRYLSKHGQADALETIYPHLGEDELDYVRKGINSKGAKKHGNDPIYRKSTGFEVLVGYLYLTNKERLIEILEKIVFE